MKETQGLAEYWEQQLRSNQYRGSSLRESLMYFAKASSKDSLLLGCGAGVSLRNNQWQMTSCFTIGAGRIDKSFP